MIQTFDNLCDYMEEVKAEFGYEVTKGNLEPYKFKNLVNACDKTVLHVMNKYRAYKDPYATLGADALRDIYTIMKNDGGLRIVWLENI